MSRKMLVIAGDPQLGLDYEQALCARGHDARYHDNAANAVQTAMATGCDLILLGQTVSGPDPLVILRHAKSVPLAPPVLVLSCDASVDSAVAAMREGAADYVGAPCDLDKLLAAIQRLERRDRADQAGAAPSAGTVPTPTFEGMLGRCPGMREVFRLIQHVAPTESTILVTGESGTGKEMIVRAIHRHSRRRDFPLLACDCTALAPTLLESELFGHVKGSFSGAVATKKGLFEVAHQGTLFLDEVANLSMETQAKLLRLLETRRLRKVGDTAEHEVDIRLIATANRDLAELVKEGKFRADLYYRLNVVPVWLPPLRERCGDIPLLAAAFLQHFTRQIGVELGGFSSEAMRQMSLYAWPGNVRELRNIVERLAVLYGGSRIELIHLPPEIRDAKPLARGEELPRSWEDLKRLKRHIIQDLERRFLIEALERSSHNVTHAAESVGMQRTNFHALLRSHGIRPDAKAPT